MYVLLIIKTRVAYYELDALYSRALLSDTAILLFLVEIFYFYSRYRKRTYCTELPN